jgi:hypothetical protein
MIFRSEFVIHAPEKLEPNVLYISIQYSSAIHLCPCGCGNEIVTKISPARWRFTYDGENISLSPSIGNFSLECRSHYFIEKNKIIWARDWSEERVSRGRSRDKKELDVFVRKANKRNKEK